MRSKITDGVTIEDVAKKWKNITDMSKAQHLDTIEDATLALVSSLDTLRASSPQKTRNDGDVFRFDSRDVILYALGGKYFTAMV